MDRSKKWRFTTAISHININESNNWNTSNTNNIIVNSNLPHGNVQNVSLYIALITLQKVTYSESSASINDEITDQIIISEEVSSHQNSSEIIYNTQDDNVINLLNTEYEAYVTSIHSINETNNRSINDEKNYIHKYYATLLP